MSAQYSNPAALGEPLGKYSHISRAGDLVFIAGQVGIDADGNLVGADLESQTNQTFKNLDRALKSENLSFQDVVKFTTYVVGDESVDSFYAARNEVFASIYPTAHYPPNTLLVISRLVNPDLRIEIEAVAYGPASQ